MWKQILRFNMLFVCMLAGCGPSGPEIAKVEGTVTMDGKPLAKAVVVFVPVGGRPSSAETDEKGWYRLDFSAGRKGAIPGPNRVEITTFSPAGIEADGTPVPARKEIVPAIYNRDTTLEFNVVPQKANTANFDLKSSGKIKSDANSY